MGFSKRASTNGEHLFKDCVFLGVIGIIYPQMATIAFLHVWGTHTKTMFMDGSCSHCESVFMKVREATLAPLEKVGMCILYYIDNWLILAQSWELVCLDRDRSFRT